MKQISFQTLSFSLSLSRVIVVVPLVAVVATVVVYLLSLLLLLAPCKYAKSIYRLHRFFRIFLYSKCFSHRCFVLTWGSEGLGGGGKDS